MIEITTIPHINAVFNVGTVICLVLGRIFAKAGNGEAHKKVMMTSLVLSALFLTFYVTYHLNGGFAKFGGEGWVRPLYFAILLIHVVGAIAIVPLVPMAVWRAISGDIDRHRRLVRWTWPLWTFVATSGVFVYLMAFHLYPYADA